jgi:hypothetical protein
MRNFLQKLCRENQNAYFMFNNFFFENHAVYDISWKNVVETERLQMAVKYDTDSEYLICIASPILRLYVCLCWKYF